MQSEHKNDGVQFPTRYQCYMFAKRHLRGTRGSEVFPIGGKNAKPPVKFGEPSFTLTAQDKHGVYDGCKIRRLTPTECERLQGFPDGWTTIGTEGRISDAQRYKCLGNAVTTNVVAAIMGKILTL